MNRRFRLPAPAPAIAVALTLAAATIALARFTPAAAATAAHAAKWPAWISIESPVNPYDQTERGAAMIVHVTLRDRVAALADLSGSAEGLVNGARRTVPLRFEATSQPGAFSLRRQWPSGGQWLVRISFASTTALVTLDRTGSVASAVVPTRAAPDGMQLPREVSEREIAAMLANAAQR